MTPLRAHFYRFEADEALSGISWRSGQLLHAEAEWDDDRPPATPIELTVEGEPDDEAVVYPELVWSPVPLMSRRLVAALQAAGVDNLQLFETRMLNTPGENPPPADHYLAINVVGLVAAADLTASRFDEARPERVISVDFHSLVIDEAKAHNFGMFRLAENTSAVLVHERVRASVLAAGIHTLTWFEPEQWAG